MLWRGVENGYIFITRVLTQWIFMFMYFFICNLENYEKIEFMKVKKMTCGSQMPSTLGPEPPNFFYLALRLDIGWSTDDNHGSQIQQRKIKSIRNVF